MISPSLHSVRVLDQEIDTIEIWPSHPEYVVIGTYHLLKDSSPDGANDSGKEEDEKSRNPRTTTRIGSIQVLLIDHVSKSPNPEQSAECLCRFDTASAILDIHFCPTDSSLIGAATSTGELQFFRLTGLPIDVRSEHSRVRIVPVGIANVYDDIEGPDSAPLITQFTWIKSANNIEANCAQEVIHHLAVCDTLGRVRIVRVELPCSTAEEFSKDSALVSHLATLKVTVHKHLYDLEAWTLSSIALGPTDDGNESYIVLSGGDDSCLIASRCTLGTTNDHQYDASDLSLLTSQQHIQTDKRTHTSGVVSILPITPPRASTGGTLLANRMPILTGSYDQNLRLLLFDRVTHRFECVSCLELEGGVWRVMLLDTYMVDNTEPQESETHYVLLVSAMYAGCYIIRLVCRAIDKSPLAMAWSWDVSFHFASPHESMVYACTAKVVNSDHHRDKFWRVISTSFYDKRICVWDWTDSMHRNSIER